MLVSFRHFRPSSRVVMILDVVTFVVRAASGKVRRFPTGETDRRTWAGQTLLRQLVVVANFHRKKLF